MILIDTQKEEFTKLKDIRIFEKLDNEQRYNGDLLVIGLGGMGPYRNYPSAADKSHTP